MPRPNLRVIAGRPVYREVRTVSPYAGLVRFTQEVAGAIFAGLCILAAVWGIAAILFSLEAR